jgi:hypothetical protein
MTKLYMVVNDWQKGICVTEEEVVKETQKTFTLSGRSRGFGYAKRLIKSESEFYFTPDEAYAAFIDKLKARINHAEAEIEGLRALVAEAQRQLEVLENEG